MRGINPDTLKDLFLAAMTGVQDFEYLSGEQPFVIRHKSQCYYVYITKLTSAYFKSRPDTTRAQLNRRACFDDIKKSPEPFIFLGYDGENDVFVCWNYKIVKARLNEKNTVSFYSRKIYQDQIVLGEPRHFELRNGDHPYFFKRKDLPLFLDKVDTLFPDTIEVDNTVKHQETKSPTNVPKDIGEYLYDYNLINELRPMLVGPAKRTLEAIQTVIKYMQTKYGICISMRECMGLLKNLHLDNHDGYDLQMKSFKETE